MLLKLLTRLTLAFCLLGGGLITVILFTAQLLPAMQIIWIPSTGAYEIFAMHVMDTRTYVTYSFNESYIPKNHYSWSNNNCHVLSYNNINITDTLLSIVNFKSMKLKQIYFSNFTPSEHYQWSHDSNWGLLRHDSHFYIIENTTLNITDLSEFSSLRTTFSPDLSQMAYVKTDGNKYSTYIRNLRTKETRLVIQEIIDDPMLTLLTPDQNRRWEWSPTGKYITSPRFGAYEHPFGKVITLIDLETNQISYLTSLPPFLLQIVWSSNEQYIALVAEHESNNYIYYPYIYDIFNDKLTELDLTLFGEGYFTKPFWSPDGSKVAFIGINSQDLLEVLVVDVLNKKQSKTSPSQTGFSPYYSDYQIWSYNNRWLAIPSNGFIQIFDVLTQQWVYLEVAPSFELLGFLPHSNTFAYAFDNFDKTVTIKLVDLLNDELVTTTHVISYYVKTESMEIEICK